MRCATSFTSRPFVAAHTRPQLTRATWVWPHRFIEHGTQAEQLDQAGLSAQHIASTALIMLGKKKGLLSVNGNGVHVA